MLATMVLKKNPQDTAAAFISQWQARAIAPDNSHINFIADNADTNGLLYNLYADQLLRLNLVSDDVYQVVTKFYNNAVGEHRVVNRSRG